MELSQGQKKSLQNEVFDRTGINMSVDDPLVRVLEFVYSHADSVHRAADAVKQAAEKASKPTSDLSLKIGHVESAILLRLAEIKRTVEAIEPKTDNTTQNEILLTAIKVQNKQKMISLGLAVAAIALTLGLVIGMSIQSPTYQGYAHGQYQDYFLIPIRSVK